MKKYLLCILLCLSCSKEPYNFAEVFPSVFKDLGVLELKGASVTLSITIAQDYNHIVTRRGFYYATTQEALADPNTRRVFKDPSFGTGHFTAHIEHLLAETTYYYQAFATNAQGTALSEIKSFTTLQGTPAQVVTEPPRIEEHKIMLKGKIADTGGYPITEYGFYYSTTQREPSDADLTLHRESPSYRRTEFAIPLENFQAGAHYYVRAFVVTRMGKSLGEVITFDTNQAPPILEVSLEAPEQITNTSARLKMRTTQGRDMTGYIEGFLYSEFVQIPVLEKEGVLQKGATKSAEHQYYADLMDLRPAKKYYVRAYLQNQAGIVYSEPLTLHTKPEKVPQGVRLDHYDRLTSHSVVLYGSVSSAEGGRITSRGLVYSTSSESLTIERGRKLDALFGTGDFSAHLTSLEPNTQYFAKAYAANEYGIAYSEPLTFVTEPVGEPSQLRITFNQATTNSIELRATVSQEGGGTILSRGFVYSVSDNQPTLEHQKQEAGSGSGSFSATLSGLRMNTTYYVRAYATNQRGTFYSETHPITTQNISLPTLSTVTPREISSTKAKLIGELTSNGGGDIRRYGFIYSPHDTSPTIEGDAIQLFFSGEVSGVFQGELTGLGRNTTYYVRAYAINERGVSYSPVYSFKTASLSIGDSYQGGVVAYLFTPSDIGYVEGQAHGYLIPPIERWPAMPYTWGCDLSPHTTGILLGTGRDNTIMIAEECSNTSASYYIKHYFRASGHDDWFIPSRMEFSNIADQRVRLGLPTGEYWTSSQKDKEQAYYMSITPSTSRTGVAGKRETKKVIPIREF